MGGRNDGGDVSAVAIDTPRGLPDMVAPRLSSSWAFKQPGGNSIALYRPEDIVVELSASDVSYGAGSGPKHLGDYLLGDQLGEGSYGKVKEALNVRNHRVYAMKIIRQRQLRRIKNGEENVKREISVMQQLGHHPNIVRLHEVIEDNEGEKICLVLDYIDGGTLEQLRSQQTRGRFAESQARGLFKQLIDGLDYMHQQGFAHRDVKPDNMMITSDGTLKLSDFSVSFPLSQDIVNGVSGAPAIQPPEVASGQCKAAGPPGDIWAAGVTLYLLTTGQYPFAGSSLVELFDNIAHVHSRPAVGVSDTLADLLGGILAPLERRLSIAQIREHPWMQLPTERVCFIAQRRTSFDGLRIDKSVPDAGDPMDMMGMLMIDGPDDSGASTGDAPGADSPPGTGIDLGLPRVSVGSTRSGSVDVSGRTEVRKVGGACCVLL